MIPNSQLASSSPTSSALMFAGLELEDIPASKSDLFFAHELVNFYQEHGHYAPTISSGGSDLTHWVRNMRKSNGTIGVYPEGGVYCSQALSILREKIPDFDLRLTIPLAANSSLGPSSSSSLMEASRLKGRKADIYDCARNSTLFELNASKFFLRMPKYDHDLPIVSLVLLKIAHRSLVFHQGLKAQYSLHPDDPVQTWWTTGVVQSAHSKRRAEAPFSLNLRRACPVHGGFDEFETPEIVDLVAWGYTPDASEYVVALKCRDESVVRLSYDALLADQSHPHITPFELDRSFFLNNRKPAPFDWHEWLTSTYAPQRHSSNSTTCNRAFECNLQKLKDWLAVNGNKHLTWSGTGHLYKFIEHQLLKKSRGTMGFSHRERLASLEFTWGLQHHTAKQLFGHCPK
jgi:hypothetical protein